MLFWGMLLFVLGLGLLFDMPAKQLWGLVLAGIGLGIIVSVRLQRRPNSLWNPFFFVPFVWQQMQQGPRPQSESRPSDQK